MEKSKNQKEDNFSTSQISETFQMFEQLSMLCQRTSTTVETMADLVQNMSTLLFKLNERVLWLEGREYLRDGGTQLS